MRIFRRSDSKDRRPGDAVPIGDDDWAGLKAAFPLLRRVPVQIAEKLRMLAAEFVRTRDFEALRGLEMKPEMPYSVAALACLPIVELGLKAYRGWHSIFLVPREYRETRREIDHAGVVTEYEDELSGEVMELGPVVFSWADVLRSGQGEGFNVVIHEAAHKLDDLNGAVDGAPALPREAAREWRAAFSEAFTEFTASLSRPQRTRRCGSIDEYAAESPSEFFAVLCEYFFERPLRLRLEFPRVYICMSDYFRLDPAAWI